MEQYIGYDYKDEFKEYGVRYKGVVKGNVMGLLNGGDEGKKELIEKVVEKGLEEEIKLQKGIDELRIESVKVRGGKIEVMISGYKIGLQSLMKIGGTYYELNVSEYNDYNGSN